MTRRLLVPILYGLLVGCVPASSLFAQGKIGYVDLEYVLSQMPERNEMREELKRYVRVLEERRSIGCWWPQISTGEIEASLANPSTPDELKQELRKMIQDRETMDETAQLELERRHSELFEPILQKAQDAIRQVATQKGYTYILRNQYFTIQDIQVSLILYAPTKDNLTEAVLQELGIN